MRPHFARLACLVAASALPLCAGATDVYGAASSAGDGRALCAFDQNSTSPVAPAGVTFIDISTSANATFNGSQWVCTSANGCSPSQLIDDWYVGFTASAFNVSWLGIPSPAGNFVEVGTKGWATSVEQCNPSCPVDSTTQYALPSSNAAIKPAIAALWTDLTYCPANATVSTPPTSAIYFKQVVGPPQQTIIEWKGFGWWDATKANHVCTAPLTFEVIWDNTNGTADVVFQNGFSFPAGSLNSNAGLLAAAGQDQTPSFGASYVAQRPVGGASAAAGTVARLIECDAPSIAFSPASATVAQGGQLAITATGTPFTGLSVDNASWTWSASAGTITPGAAGSATLNTTNVACGTGTITVTARVKDSQGRLSKPWQVPYTMTDVAPTVTAIGASPAPQEGTQTTMTATFSDPGGTADTYTFLWSFDDGTTSTLQNPTHKFTTAGAHSVTVAVTDNCGKSGTLTQNVTVGNIAPTMIVFSPSTASPVEGTAMSFNASASDPGKDGPYVYKFDSGDAADPGHLVTVSAADGATATIPYTYKKPGTFTASVTATDANNGVSAPLTLSVTVSNVAPQASLSCGSGRVDVGYPITCTCSVTDPGSSEESYAYAIGWGDGSPPTNAASGSHAYSAAKGYTASCTVNDGNGGTGTGQASIVVGGGPTAPVPQSPPNATQWPSTTVAFQWLDSTSTVVPVVYNIEVCNDAACNNVIPSASATGVPEGNCSGASGSTCWTSPVALTENGQYWWRVQADDGQMQSQWSSIWTFGVNAVNEAPGSPTVDLPADGGKASSATPLLQVYNAPEPDPFPLVTYTFEIYADAQGTTLVSRQTGVPQDPSGVTGWPVPSSANLQESQVYYWRARATNVTNGANLDGPWGPPAAGTFWSFRVVTTNHPPTTPGIVSPIDGSRVTSLSVTLDAATSTDPDGDPITYEFQISTDSTFAQGPTLEIQSGVTASGGDVTWTPPDRAEDTEYYWRVRASDGQSLSAWSNTASFFVDATNEPPTAPGIVSPPDQGYVSDVKPVFDASPATDPDRDPLTYRFEVQDMGGTAIASQDGVAAAGSDVTWTIPTALTRGMVYQWRCGAVDGRSPGPTFSAWATFRVGTGSLPVAVTLTASPTTAADGATVTLKATVANAGLSDLPDVRLGLTGDGLDLDFGSAKLDGKPASVVGQAVKLGSLLAPSAGGVAGPAHVVTLSAKITSAAASLGVATASATAVDPTGAALSDTQKTDVSATRKPAQKGGCSCGGGAEAPLLALLLAGLKWTRRRRAL